MLIALWWYTYSLEVNWEAEDGWYNLISESDNLTRPIKIILLKMFTAKYRRITCSEFFPLQRNFPLPPHLFVFGKPSKWKQEIWTSKQKYFTKEVNLIFFFLPIFFPFPIIPIYFFVLYSSLKLLETSSTKLPFWHTSVDNVPKLLKL